MNKFQQKDYHIKNIAIFTSHIGFWQSKGANYSLNFKPNQNIFPNH